MFLKKKMLVRLFGTSIKTQLLGPLFFLTAFSIVVVGFLGIRAVSTSGGKAEHIADTSMQQRVEQFMNENVKATADNNSLIFKNIQLASNAATQYATNVLNTPGAYSGSGWVYDRHITPAPGGGGMNGADETSSVYMPPSVKVTPAVKQEMERSAYYDDFFPGALANEKDAVAMYFIGTQGETRYYPNIGLGTIVPPAYTPVGDVFYTPITPENDPSKMVQWSEVYNDPAGNGLLITASNPIYTNGGFAGMVGIDVTLNNVAKNIENYTPIESSYAVLLNQDGRAIAMPAQAYHDMLGRAPKKGEFGTDLSHVGGDFGTVLTKMRKGAGGFAQLHASGQDLDMAYAPVKGTPFSLAIVAKQSTLLKVVSDLRTQVEQSTRAVLYAQMLPIAIVLLLIVWIASFLYVRFITQPIIELTERTHRVTEGDLNQRMHTITENEVGKLATAFNTMTTQLSEYYGALERKVRDRTRALDRKVAEVSAAKSKDDAILESIGDGMIVTDDKGNILLINEIATELCGLAAPAKMIGKKTSEIPFYDEKDARIPAEKRPLHQALTSGKKVTQDLHTRSAAGFKKALSITATPVKQGDKIIGAIEMLRDVTKEKEVDRMKTEFISLASHQLRTPLSAINWFSEMLMSGDVGKLKAQQLEVARNIYESSGRMTQLVGSLLNISRIESGRIMVDPKPTNLNELVAGIVKDLEAKIKERNQTIIISVNKELPDINLDPRLIGQVYLNLLTNAIKYTPKGGEISLFISRKDDQVISQVTDTGYGIPKEEQSKMFQKFFRASNAVKVEADGTGLGMYLVKAIVESSGGKIWFESKEGKGTTFWFSLPLSGMKRKKGEVTLEAQRA
ncbi:MAG TPA: ATP-binding protein [Candidatus Saccharimonadales bacterium]